MSVDERRLERLQRRIEELRAWRNARQVSIPDWIFTASDGQARNLKLGDFWPVHDVPVYFKAKVTVPDDWSGFPVELELWLGGEGFLQLSTGYQAGLNPMHHRFPVAEHAAGGESITINAEVVPKGIFGTHIDEPRLERASLVIPQRDVRALERDLTMLHQACLQLADQEVAPFLLDAAEAALDDLSRGWPTASQISATRYLLGYDNGLGNGVDAVPADWFAEAIDARRPTDPTWSLPSAPGELESLPPEAVEAVYCARATFADRLEQLKADYPPIGRLVLSGHAHIDLAWLWPVAETRRKTRRTFSTVLDLMDRYDDFTFNQSSAQAYVWIEHDDPALFDRIRQRVAEGRWEYIGGMWVESDCNVTGGEAFARQLIYGQRYFEQTFGRRNAVAWLPDVFGFSGGVPQLLRGAGVTGFFTTKLNWSEENTFPYDLFTWEGIDGSQVTAHMFLNPGWGYNGNIVPLDTLGTWRNFRGKRLHPESLLAFGWGDGAGGPSEKMLENYARIKDFPALPRLRMGKVEEFYSSLPERDSLPKWVGELYLELHRGTLTTQAKTKALNRASEHRLLEAEAFGAIASLDGYSHPRESLEEAWKTLLLNQFHDILPGSSIAEVYQDTNWELGNVVGTATSVRDQAIHALIGTDADSTRFVIANAGLAPRPLHVVLRNLSGNVTVRASDGTALATQEVAGGLIVAGDQDVPGLGWTTLTVERSGDQLPVDITKYVSATPERGGAVLENEVIRVEISADGSIARVFDKVEGRQVLTGRGNQLWAYVDKPYSWDAWDIDEAYERVGEEIKAVERIAIVEEGPLRSSVEVERTWRESKIVQTYRLCHKSKRIDIETQIDWHQRQILLKALFPLNVRTHEATFETMYGAVRRPTHRNTSWDSARFEVGAQRFADLSEPGYGVALLNDSKYGHGVLGNVLNLSLLRSPMYPDVFADEGAHHFTYSLLPHKGDWTAADVVSEAFALNSPLLVASAGADAEPEFSFLTSEGLSIALGSLKPADIGEGLILRFYEPHGARGRAAVKFSRELARVERVNLLEDTDLTKPVPEIVGGRTIQLELGPFEIASLRLVF